MRSVGESVRAASRPSASRRTRTAGSTGQRLVARLLRRGSRPLAVENVAVSSSHVELEVRAGGLTVPLEAGPPSRDEPCFEKNDNVSIVIRLRGEACGPEHAAVARAVFAGLGRVPFARLRDALEKRCLPDRDDEAHASRLDRFSRRFDHSGDWWKFCYPDHDYLDARLSTDADGVKIQHGTRECFVTSPMLLLPSLRFFASSRGATPPRVRKYLSTHLTEQEVVAGLTFEKLRRTLDEVAERDRPASIHLATTCLAEMIGDLPGRLLDEIGRERGIATLWTAKSKDAGSDAGAWIRARLAEVPWQSEQDPRAAIVVGVESARDRAEVRDLLRSLGVSVAGHLLPELRLPPTAEVGRARAAIWAGTLGWDAVPDDALAAHVRVVRALPPFGRRGTIDWMRQVASVLEIRDAETAIGDAVARVEKALGGVPNETRAFRVGLVGDRADLDFLSRPGSVFGFSVDELLGEMGFVVRRLILGRDFDSREALDRILDREIDAAFSHFRWDPRLAAHGVPAFCEDVFGAGPGGLARAARRLLDVCRSRPAARGRPAHARGDSP